MKNFATQPVHDFPGADPVPPAVVFGVNPAATAALAPAQAGEPLSQDERAELVEHEAVISEKIDGFVEVGVRLEAIRNKRLYREKFRTFQEYCAEVWGVTDRRARQVWAASDVVRQLGIEGNRNSCSDFLLPASEAQARPLTRLPADQRLSVWLEAIRTAPGGRLTARHVEAVVRRRLGISGATPEARGNDVGAGTDPGAGVRPDRNERKIAAASRAIAAARELEMTLGSPDSAVTAKVATAVQMFEEVVAHLKRMSEMQAARP